MKRLSVLIMLIVTAFLITGCGKIWKTLSEDRKLSETEQVQQNQKVANDVVRQIIYIKDARTNICYAYFWEGAANGGPALTEVPCDSIPPELLWIGSLPDTT